MYMYVCNYQGRTGSGSHQVGSVRAVFFRVADASECVLH